MKPEIKIYDCKTGETIVREMTDEEFLQYQSDLAKFESEKQAEQAKKDARQALLNRLGITEEEAQLLLGGN